MGTEVATGLSVTRGAPTSPDATFVWDVNENAGNLAVKVSYGGGTATDNVGTATIAAGSTAWVNIVPANNNQISVGGKVSALWSDGNESYVVIFSGFMVRPNVNDVESSDQNGAPSDNYQIIVYAYMD